METRFLRIRKITSYTFLSIALFFSSCKKDDEEPVIQIQPLTEHEAIGVYVLNEGVYSSEIGASESSITFYSIKDNSTEQDYYKKVNGQSLGVNANYLKSYGSKLYCVVTGTEGDQNSYVDVMDLNTGKSIKRIVFYAASSSKMPRYITFDKGKAYVSAYDGSVSKIDTSSLNIEASVQLSKGLEQLVIAKNKLYVANSKHPFHEGKANVVSVVDLNTFTKVRDIEVNTNPTGLTLSSTGDLFVSSQGTYSDTWEFQNNASVTRIDVNTDTKKDIYKYNSGKQAVSLTSHNGLTYAYGEGVLKVFSVFDGSLGVDFVKDNTSIGYTNELTIEALSNNVYISDSGDFSAGKVICFEKNGKKKFDFIAQAFPKSVAFKYLYK